MPRAHAGCLVQYDLVLANNQYLNGTVTKLNTMLVNNSFSKGDIEEI